jgi:hypothetical protein
LGNFISLKSLLLGLKSFYLGRPLEFLAVIRFNHEFAPREMTLSFPHKIAKSLLEASTKKYL